MTQLGRRPRREAEGDVLCGEETLQEKKVEAVGKKTYFPLSLRLEGPHHHYFDTTWPTEPNHHAEPHGLRSRAVRGAHLPGTALQLTGESAWEN